MTHTPQLAGALNWASRGFFVFPVEPNGKKSLVSDWPNVATTDDKRIHEWANDFPGCNWACVPGRSECIAFDLDRKNGKDGLAELERLAHDNGFEIPDTLVVKTPTGGFHFYYHGAASATVGKIAPGIDVRGTDPHNGRASYVLIPGSEIDGRGYTVENDLETWAIPDAPEKLLLLANSDRNEPQLAPADVALDQPQNIERARALLRQYIAAGDVANEGQGGDNRTYQAACEVLNLGLSIDGAFDLLCDEWNLHCVPPWSGDELRTKIENAATYAQNEQGAYAVPSAQQTFAAVAQFADQRAPNLKRSKFFPLFPRDMRDLPDPSWLVANLIPAHAVAVLYGPTGTFKTFTALDIGVAVAAGIPIWERAVAQGAVAYCAGESPLGIARKRLPALMQYREIADPDAVPFALVPAVPLVSTPSDIEALIAALKGTGLRFALIVIDTVARALGGLDENSAKDVGLLRAAMEQLRDTFDCSVLLIHHTGKDESRGARGSSALIADLDAAFESKADPEVLAVTLRCEKQRDADPFTPIRLKGKPAYGSIVFDPIKETEYAALTRSNTSTHNSDVGQALKALGAINGKTVTTHVLAMEMAGPDAPAEAIEAKKRALQRCAKDRLRAYVDHLGEGRGQSTLWTMPELSEGGSE